MSAVIAKIMMELWFGKDEKKLKFTIYDIFDLFKKEEHKDVKTAIKNLKRGEFIEQKQNYDGSALFSLSEKGKLRALNYVFKKFENRKEKWDGKWRMVSYDIPVYCTKGRKALVYRLKAGGFYEIQKSLFIYPYDCEKEIKALASLFKIEKYVLFGLLDSVDNQDLLLRHFKLIN
jgi:DNA-binding transcriptional regulator PaaX